MKEKDLTKEEMCELSRSVISRVVLNQNLYRGKRRYPTPTEREIEDMKKFVYALINRNPYLSVDVKDEIQFELFDYDDDLISCGEFVRASNSIRISKRLFEDSIYRTDDFYRLVLTLFHETLHAYQSEIIEKLESEELTRKNYTRQADFKNAVIIAKSFKGDAMNASKYLKAIMLVAERTNSPLHQKFASMKEEQQLEYLKDVMFASYYTKKHEVDAREFEVLEAMTFFKAVKEYSKQMGDKFSARYSNNFFMEAKEEQKLNNFNTEEQNEILDELKLAIQKLSMAKLRQDAYKMIKSNFDCEISLSLEYYTSMMVKLIYKEMDEEFLIDFLKKLVRSGCVHMADKLASKICDGEVFKLNDDYKTLVQKNLVDLYTNSKVPILGYQINCYPLFCDNDKEYEKILVKLLEQGKIRATYFMSSDYCLENKGGSEEFFDAVLSSAKKFEKCLDEGDSKLVISEYYSLMKLLYKMILNMKRNSKTKQSKAKLANLIKRYESLKSKMNYVYDKNNDEKLHELDCIKKTYGAKSVEEIESGAYEESSIVFDL